MSKDAQGQAPAWWDQAVHLKDEASIKEIGERLGVDPVAIASEFARRGIRRRIRVDAAADHEHAPVNPPAPAAPSARPSARQAEPPARQAEPPARRAEPAPRPAARPVPVEDTSIGRRTGSKDARIERWFEQLGKVPDSEIARLADVSIRTVASYRARHDIAGYDGPRRRPAPRGRRTSKVGDFGPLLGKVPDRVIADIAGMSLGAVRNFRIKKGLPAAGRITRREIDKLVAQWERAQERPVDAPRPAAKPVAAVAVPTGGTAAWKVEQADGTVFVVIAPDLVGAVTRATTAAHGQLIQRVEKVGRLL